MIDTKMPGTPPRQADDKLLVLESPRGVRSFPHHYHEEVEEGLSTKAMEQISNYRGWLEAGVPFETVSEWMKIDNGFSRPILENVIDGNVDYFFPEQAITPMLPLFHDVINRRATEMAANACLEIAASTYRRMLLSGVSYAQVFRRMQQDGVADNKELVDIVCNLTEA